MTYLKGKGNLQLFILFELLYKFGVRVGALSKLKVKDLSEDGVLIFHEKNNKSITRKLKNKLNEKLRKFIRLNSFDINDYIFFPHLSCKDEDRRAKLFSNMLARSLKESNCFKKKKMKL